MASGITPNTGNQNGIFYPVFSNTIPYGQSLVTLMAQGDPSNYVVEYPDASLPLSSKVKKDYCLKFAKAFFSDCIGNPYVTSLHAEFAKRRAYSRGAQGMAKYTMNFTPNNGAYNSTVVQGLRNKVIATLPGENVKLLTARLASMRGMLVPDKIVPKARVNDPKSLLDRSRQLARIRGGYETLTGDPQMAEVATSIGLPLLPPKLMGKVKTGRIEDGEDLEAELSEFTMDVEEAVGRTLSGILYQMNDWRAIYNDAIKRLQTDGIALMRVDESESGKTTIRVCDNVNLLMKLPMRQDLSDLEGIGELVLMDVGMLKMLPGAQEYKQGDWDRLMRTITPRGDGFGNPVSSRKVLVMDLEWMEYVKFSFKSSKPTNGGMEMVKVSEGAQGKEREDEPVQANRRNKLVKVVFRAYWVVGTDMVFRYGVKEAQVRGGNGEGYAEAKLGFVGYCPSAGDSTHYRIDSIVGDVVNLVDEYEINRVSILSELAQAPKSIRGYNERMLDVIREKLNLSNVVQVMTVIEDIRRVIIPQDIAGMVVQGAAKAPLMQDEPSGLDFNELNFRTGRMLAIMQEIADIMGIPRGYDGHNADPNMPVSTQRIMGGAVSARMNDYRIAGASITRGVLHRAGRLAQLAIQQYQRGEIDENPFADLLPDRDEDVLMLLSRVAGGDYVFDYSETMPQEEKEQLLGLMNQSLAAGTLMPDEMLLILHKVNGDPLSASRELRKLREKREKARGMEQEQIAKITQEGSIAAAKESAQAAKELEIEKLNSQKELMMLKHKLEMEAEAQRHAFEMEKAGLMAGKDVEVAKMKHEGKEGKEVEGE